MKVRANGALFHAARAGTGNPLLLLHGWPEFDFVYPGIGPRMGVPDRLNHIWYQSFHQMEMKLSPIHVPTCVRWAEHDPLFPYTWTDRMGATFSNLDLSMFTGAGHFPHREDPDRAAAEITAFFEKQDWR